MTDVQASRFIHSTTKSTAEFMALTDGPPLPSADPPLNLLVVDDDEHIREVCRTVATDMGMRVRDVSTAEEAVEVLEQLSVDILLTDLRLPGTSGLELLKRATVTHPDVAVAMLTQYGTGSCACARKRAAGGAAAIEGEAHGGARARMDRL